METCKKEYIATKYVINTVFVVGDVKYLTYLFEVMF